ncbi:hypothetical protein VRK_08840 [Vibrio sp. MEBiC08052]|nr:hypothetical protein VRK_08840 [Vibrio sp. MEBiC08052]
MAGSLLLRLSPDAIMVSGLSAISIPRLAFAIPVYLINLD